MNSRTPALVNGGGRSFWLPMAALALGGLAAASAMVIVARRGADEWRPPDTARAEAAAPASDDPVGEGTMSIDDVTLVLERHRDRLMQLPGVIGLYVGADHQSNLVLRIILLHGYPGTRAQLPTSLDGVPVEIEESEPIRPL